MSPENDQTRWVGVRPTSPAEDIPVTLNGEVPHVIVDSGCEGGLKAGQPKMAVSQAGLAANTYHTLLDYTGAGAFSTIEFYDPTTLIDGCSLKITVDGTVALEFKFDDTGEWYSCSLDYGGAVRKRARFDWGLVAFETSLKIEYKHVNAVTLRVACMYQTYS